MIDKIVEYANKNKKISDFHLRSGCDFSYREIGEIIVDKSIKITEKNLEELLNKHCTPQDVETFKKNNELDCAFKLEDIRFRANFYRSLKGISVVLRKVETKILSMEELNLPPVLYDLVDAHKGLVLVTGPTGSGKSTTLAAIINQINETRQANIITIEDPVEFIHEDKKSIVSQREVGKQTESFL